MTPQIHFIHLPSPNKDEMICRHTSKLYDQGHRVLIHTANAEQSAYLDRLLWTFEPDSFIPHAAMPCDITYHRILLSHEEPIIKNINALILASDGNFDYMQQFSILIDFAEVYDPQRLQSSRERFKRWKEAGFSPIYHKE